MSTHTHSLCTHANISRCCCQRWLTLCVQQQQQQQLILLSVLITAAAAFGSNLFSLLTFTYFPLTYFLTLVTASQTQTHPPTHTHMHTHLHGSVFASLGNKLTELITVRFRLGKAKLRAACLHMTAFIFTLGADWKQQQQQKWKG